MYVFRKFRKHKFLFFVSFVTTVILFVICNNYEFYRRQSTIITDRDVKTILYWNPMFGRSDHWLGFGEEVFKTCEYKNCFITDNKRFLPVDQFNAIIFHAPELNERVYNRPRSRKSNQVYIFENMESPPYSRSYYTHYNNFFNWTMTYRTDSDIVRLYGRLEKQKTNYTPPSVNDIQSKTKKVAWFVSHCRTSSQREYLKDAISSYIPIDVFGHCGNLTCPRTQEKECYKNYKFYLSFENSFCTDYVTEKLFNVLQHDLVPIVYGGANYTNAAPPNSVIDIKDFDSLEELTNYIKFLDENPQEYLKYFEWKKDYVIKMDYAPTKCDLCRKLNEPLEYKTISEITHWWQGHDNAYQCNYNFLIKFLKLYELLL